MMFPNVNFNLRNLNGYLIVLVFSAFLSLISSCVTQRKVEYLQDRNKNIKAFNEAEFPDYRLKSNDELYIQINSLDEAAANVFSNVTQQQSLVSV